MATLLTASVLSDDEKLVINRLSAKIRKDQPALDLNDRYFEGQQRLRHMGIAVPPELRMFETVINVPRMAVDEPERRQGLRAFYRAGDSTKEDPALREAWEYNNLASESSLVHKEEKIFGRTFVSVGSNADDADHPLITVEDPRQVAVDVDPQGRRIREMLRLYKGEDGRTTQGTLLRPESTVHIVRGKNGWVVNDGDGLGRDDHDLGAVPVVMFANRRRAGQWGGMSEMADVIGLTDSIARILSVMQLGAETLAIPHIFIMGATMKDFVDEKGNPIPAWESYMTAIRALEKEGAKVQQVQGADLENFNKAINNMLAWCAAVLGLPTRYAGQQTVNPAAEGAIRADESRLIKNVERMNAFDGDAWAWVMGLEERFRTSEWGVRNSIRTLWYDPATPTNAQTADAAVKLRLSGTLSVEGVWDMLGWDEARKSQEKGRLAQEQAAGFDPYLIAQADGQRSEATFVG